MGNWVVVFEDEVSGSADFDIFYAHFQIINNDCNGNDILDECDISDGTSSDKNGDGIPDECSKCPQDLNGNGLVNAADLALLLGAWGPNPGHDADFNGDDR